MPQSLARVVLHVVFSTKNRVPFLHALSKSASAARSNVVFVICSSPVFLPYRSAAYPAGDNCVIRFGGGRL